MKGLIFGMLVTVCGSVLLLLIVTGIYDVYCEIIKNIKIKEKR